ncbi:uncharacterized protein [Takifugu rubripes]|uniref:uncharacterized protein n=1 Tax=Takifugu rubripes TaxID=31033 RepID=UPI001145F403|nr:uncharacterized protein LOC105419497 [Takifugu rubripes]
MSARCALGFVGLVSTLLGALSVPAQGRSVHTGSQHRLETCIQSQSDHGALVCCEDGLHGGAELSCCGLRAFDPTAATCCKVDLGNDVRANLTEGLSQITSSCCGLQAYHTLSEICCEGTVVTKPAMKARCCGKVCSNLMEVIAIFFKISEAIDADLQLCCGPNSTILNRISSHHRCCGYKQYNTQTHTCDEINGSLEISAKISEAIDADLQLCCGPNSTILNRISSHHRCCGYKQYNTQTHTCDEINGSLEISAKISARCGTKTYNTHSQLCCESTVVAKPSARAKCCGNKAIDADLQLCCGPNSTILNRTSSHHHCCEYKQYNTQTHTCDEINGSLEISAKISARCGTKTYNTHSQLCCESTVVAKPSARAKCCGNKAIDADLQLCCGPNSTILNRTSSHHHCCEYKQYNTQTHTCDEINGSLEISAKISARCGTKTYNTHSQLCCRSTVVAKPSARAKCCGNKAIDADLQLCCGPNSTILNRTSSHHHCCGYKQYHNYTHTCDEINGSLEISAKISARCGTKTYNTHSQLCCRSTVVAKPSARAKCCGNKAIDADLQLCCGPNSTILNRTSSHHRCCGYKQYHNYTHTCDEINGSLEISAKISGLPKTSTDIIYNHLTQGSLPTLNKLQIIW